MTTQSVPTDRERDRQQLNAKALGSISLRSHVRLALVLSIGIVAASATGCSSGIKDIRPPSVMDGVTDDESEKARALLSKAASNAGGRELLSQHAGFRTEMTDVWINTLGKLMFLKYAPEQKLLVEATGPRVENVSMTLVGGERDGEVWGLEDNRVFIQEKGGPKTFTDDEVTMLYVKNPAALVLVPLRLAYADKVSYMGTIEYEGRVYERVFATWETLDPNLKFDQWIVWIDQKTGNIAKARLTVREYTGMLVDEAVAEFSDYKTFGDVTLPTTISALFSLDDADPIRTWTVTSFAWTDEADLVPASASGAAPLETAPASQPASVGAPQ